MFKGAITALITPFKNGKVDEKRLVENVEYQIKSGINGLVPCGTTGESPTLSHEEHKRVIEIVIKSAAGRVPVIAGTGSNSTEEALELTAHAKNAGADAALIVSPYYNKPTQKGLYLHFKTIAEEVDIPIVIYNIPGRCGVFVENATMAKLSEIKNIVGVKESTGSIDNACQIISSCKPGFDLLSGDDYMTLAYMAMGGKGVISVISNILPKEVSELAGAAGKSDLKKAREIYYKLFPIMKTAFIETNPIPIKTAMRMMGIDTGEMRLPMCGMEEANEKKLADVLKRMGLI